MLKGLKYPGLHAYPVSQGSKLVASRIVSHSLSERFTNLPQLRQFSVARKRLSRWIRLFEAARQRFRT